MPFELLIILIVACFVFSFIWHVAIQGDAKYSIFSFVLGTILILLSFVSYNSYVNNISYVNYEYKLSISRNALYAVIKNSNNSFYVHKFDKYESVYGPAENYKVIQQLITDKTENFHYGVYFGFLPKLANNNNVFILDKSSEFNAIKVSVDSQPIGQ